MARNYNGIGTCTSKQETRPDTTLAKLCFIAVFLFITVNANDQSIVRPVEKKDVIKKGDGTGISSPSITAQLQEVTLESKDTEEKPPCAGENGCPKSKISLEEAKAMMIANVKRNLLRALDMKEPPNGTHPKLSLDSPPISHLIKKYKMKPDRTFDESEFAEDSDYDRPQKETVISYARKALYSNQTGSFFKFSEDDMMYTVDSATIWFYVRPKLSNRSNITVDFYRYQQNPAHSEVKFDRRVIQTQKEGRWEQMPVTHLVTKWFINPETNFGIDIRCREFPDLVISGPSVGFEDKKPMLEVALSLDGRNRREKRTADMECDAFSNHPECCKYKFTISFADMGYDFVIAPERYESFYCAGDCPAHHIESNQNRMMWSVPRSFRPQKLKVCCIPTLMSDMQVMYWDKNNNAVARIVPKMKVVKCGCP